MRVWEDISADVIGVVIDYKSYYIANSYREYKYY